MRSAIVAAVVAVAAVAVVAFAAERAVLVEPVGEARAIFATAEGIEAATGEAGAHHDEQDGDAES